jgi:hypothetical protein
LYLIAERAGVADAKQPLIGLDAHQEPISIRRVYASGEEERLDAGDLHLRALLLLLF